MSQQPLFRQTTSQTVNIRRNPGCLGGCAGLIGVIVLIAIIGVATSNGGATATSRQIGTSAIVATSAPNMPGQPVSPADAAATVAAANRATQGLLPPASATSQVAITPSATPTPQQVVTVKEEAVNLRQSADVASTVVTLVPPGTDATVIGEDTTGPDGVTRYVHAHVGEQEGYLRSDLVSAPHVVTPAAATLDPNVTSSALPSKMAPTQAATSQTGVTANGGLPTAGIAMPTPVSVATGRTTQTRWTVTNISAQLVNVRDIPSVNGAVMRTLAPNEEIESGDKLIPGFDGGGTSWVGVRWGDDYTGYVRSDFVSAPKSAIVPVATPNLAATATAATPDGALQARLADLDNIVFDIACNKYHKDSSKPESWCPYAQTTGIRAHGAAGDETYLTTTLGKTQSPLARDACQTLWNWATNFDPATKQVSVLSSDGQVLANGVIGSKPCR